MSEKSEDKSVEKQQQQTIVSEDGSSSSTTTESKELINVIVKTSKERESFKLASNADIKTLRELVAERYKVELHKICLIFSGKILKDGDTLENHKMKDGYIVHLVIRDAAKTSNTTSSSGSNTNTSANTTSSSNTNQPTTNTSLPSANPTINLIPGATGAGAGAGALPFPNLGMLFQSNNGGNPMENLNQQFAQQINNPEFIRQMLDNPLMQNLYSNPEIFRSIISNNPHFQQLIERNPELNHVLSNPEILRQTFEMMRNPAAFQELMRSHDRAMSNLESLPGGYNALRRMYTELQEPMLNAAQEQFGGNPFASPNSGNTQTSTTPSNTENREPLPNPWQRSSGNSGSTNTSTNTTTNPDLSNPFRAAQQMMQQMNDNPNFLSSLVNSPMMQNMIESLASNPQMTAQLLGQQQQLFGNTGASIDNANLQSAINSISQNMQNPLFQRILTEPQAMQAIIQIQQGYQQLERVLGVPLSNLQEILGNNPFSILNNSTASTIPPANSSTNSTASSTHTTSTSSSASGAQSATSTAGAPNNTNISTNTTTATTTTTTPTSSSVPNLNASMLSQMMQQMFSVQPPSAANNEQRYQTQLSQLEAMGFTNRQENLQALTETFGNVEAAIDKLLSRMH